MANAKNGLKELWVKSSPQKRTGVLAAGFLLFIIVATVAIDLAAGEGGAPARKAPPATRTEMLLPKAADRSVETLAAGADAQKQQLAALQAQLDKEKGDKELLLRRVDDMSTNRGADGVTQDLLKEVVLLKERLDKAEANGAAAPVAAPVGGAPALGDALPAIGGAPEAPVDAAPKMRLRVSGDAKPKPQPEPENTTPRAAYVPMGGFFEAVLLNGMDAPTNPVASKNPVPALMRVKSDALLPNYFSHDIKECFVLVSGYGVMSSHRVQLRTESISCVKEDGRVVESKMEGYVVGEDGRVAPRGRLVSKQGQLIAQSLAAGTLSGIGQALAPSQIPQLNLDPTNVAPTARIGARTVMESGVASGFSDASKAAATFYLEMAREMTPVIELDAGRKLTIMLIKGLELR